MISLTHLEKVEEFFIKDLDEAELINWLKANKDNEDFRNLQEKYGSIWSKQSANLQFAFACYGKDISLLKDIYFGSKENLLQAVVLRNRHFGNDIHQSHGIGKNEVIRLYQQEKPFFGLFGSIFCNPKICPQFISDMFSTDYYGEFKQRDLAIILAYLSIYIKDNNGQVTLASWVQNAIPQTFEMDALSSIVEFIGAYKFINTNEITDLYNFQSALEIISDTYVTVSLTEKWQLDVLRNYDPTNFPPSVLEDQYSDMENVILSIQAWFAKRFLKLKPSYLYSEFKNSKNPRERVFFYQCSTLSEIFSVKYFRSEYLPYVENIIWYDDCDDENDVAKMVPEKGLKIKNVGWPSNEDKQAYKSFQKHLFSDRHVFIAALALNEKFYRQKPIRDWLRGLCSEADSYFFLSPHDIPIFGTGTCSEIFEEKFKELQKLNPEDFEDMTVDKKLVDIQTKLLAFETLHSNVIELAKEVQKMKTSLIEVSENQNKMHFASAEDSEEIKETLNDTRRQVYQIWLNDNLPNDFIARLIFKIPILGEMLKDRLR